MAMNDQPLLSVVDLSKHYPVASVLRRRQGRSRIRAVDGISFDLRKGESLGLVGESGCGKSTLARTLLKLETPTEGRVIFRGDDVFAMEPAANRRFRRAVQVVFQDPYASLNPRMTAFEIINEAWRIHPDVVAPAKWRSRTAQLLNEVGLRPEHADRYPHQFSGGQRQRIGIARALALEPELLILDEPVSALDMSIQAQVINLLDRLRERFGLSYLFIAHDLAVVRHISQRVAVMYLGRIVEQGETETIFEQPAHPYTQALLAASPLPDPSLRGLKSRIRLVGDLPDPANPPAGCRFSTRCFKSATECHRESPPLVQRGRREVACFYPDLTKG